MAGEVKPFSGLSSQQAYGSCSVYRRYSSGVELPWKESVDAERCRLVAERKEACKGWFFPCVGSWMDLSYSAYLL